MNIIVCLKTVRFLRAQTGSDPKQLNIGPGDYVDMMNPFDEAALEAALRIKDEKPDTEISIVSLGGPSAETGLRRGLAMGADAASHILYDKHGELDSWATSLILAAQARRMDFHLILCGREAIDSNAGLVGPYLAAHLAIPHVSRIVKIVRPESNGATMAECRLDRGDREIVECDLPVLLTIEKDINIARTPSLPSMLEARKRPIETVVLEDIETSKMPLGPSTNRTHIIRLSKPKAKRSYAARTSPSVSAADRAKLMMKGAGAPKSAKSNALLEGDSQKAIEDLERVLIASGVRFRSRCN